MLDQVFRAGEQVKIVFRTAREDEIGYIRAHDQAAVRFLRSVDGLTVVFPWHMIASIAVL